MAYARTTWENGVTPLNATNMNNIEDGIQEAMASGGSGKYIHQITVKTSDFTLSFNLISANSSSLAGTNRSAYVRLCEEFQSIYGTTNFIPCSGARKSGSEVFIISDVNAHWYSASSFGFTVHVVTATEIQTENYGGTDSITITDFVIAL